MSTEYKVETFTPGLWNDIGPALTRWSADGWEPIESWKWTVGGGECLAFLLSNGVKNAPKPVTFRAGQGPAPRHNPVPPPEETRLCPMCAGRGYQHHPGSGGG